jgi:hypothetical protein
LDRTKTSWGWATLGGVVAAVTALVAIVAVELLGLAVGLVTIRDSGSIAVADGAGPVLVALHVAAIMLAVPAVRFVMLRFGRVAYSWRTMVIAGVLLAPLIINPLFFPVYFAGWLAVLRQVRGTTIVPLVDAPEHEPEPVT